MLIKLTTTLILIIAAQFAWGQTHEDMVFNLERANLSVGINIYSFAGHDDFKIGNTESGWDQSERYEITFRYHMKDSERMDLYIGSYVFWEEREVGPGSNGKLSSDALGVGVESGVKLYPIERLRLFKVTPYFKAGIAAQDTILNGFDKSNGTAEADTGAHRFELGLGVDAELQIGRLELLAGAGVLYWNTGDLSITTTDVMATEFKETVDFRGDAVYYRFGFAMAF